MRQLFRKRIGQSWQEFISAVSFSFILHIIFFLAALFLYTRTAPRAFVPPPYQVTLVGPVEDLPAVTPETPPVPAPAPEEKKPRPKKAKAPTHKKGGMPELKKQKPAETEQAQPEMPGLEGMAAQPVAVSTPLDFKFPPYLAIIREKIVQNWNPPPGAKETKARVAFKIYRSGKVVDAGLMESSGNFYFDQAAMRAIVISSPFPPLPEGFFKEFAEFSVDLMEKE